MTVQLSDRLENDYRQIDLWGLSLAAVVTGDTEPNLGYEGRYRHLRQPMESKLRRATFLWSGCLCHYRITCDGNLVLEGYEYPSSNTEGPLLPGEWDEVGEILTGDFWLSLRDHTNGIRLYVPFRDGKIVADRNHWIIDDSETAAPPPTAPGLFGRWMAQLRGRSNQDSRSS